MWSLQSISTAVMKEQVRISELFQIKKFQPEHIIWKSHALTYLILKVEQNWKQSLKLMF